MTLFYHPARPPLLPREYEPRNKQERRGCNGDPQAERDVGAYVYRHACGRQERGRKRGLVFTEYRRNERDDRHPLSDGYRDVLPLHCAIVSRAKVGGVRHGSPHKQKLLRSSFGKRKNT